MKPKTRIDWEKVRAQLAHNGEILEKALEVDPARVAEILRQRALSLAGRRRESLLGQTPGCPIQVFTMNGQNYAFELGALVRILPFLSCTRVPGAPAEMLGLVNVQGDIRVAFELCRLLDPAAAAGISPGYLLLLKNGGQPVGLRVEELGPVQSLLPADLETNSGMQILAGDCGKGITRDRLVILDEEKISRKLQALNQANE